MGENKIRQVEYIFKIPQKDNIHYYDRVIAMDYTDALEIIKQKYPEAKVIEWAGDKTICTGWHPNRTGYKPSPKKCRHFEDYPDC